MVPARRSRGSLPNSPTPGDDVSTLSLPEVRDRLARNTRVLTSSLFSPSTSPSSTSVLSNYSQHQQSPGQAGQAGPSRHAPPQPVDPVRERLVQTRDALLAREAELLAQGMEGMSVTPNHGIKTEYNGGDGSPISTKGGYMSPEGGARRDSAGRVGRGSGKQRALETIRQGEAGLTQGAILLPIDQTLSLGSRDYTTQTLDTFNHLSLSKTLKPSYDPLDENARAQHLARMNNFMSHKGDGEDEYGFGEGDGDEDEEDGLERDMFGFEDGDYEGEDDTMPGGLNGTGGGDGGSGAVRREKGTGERVDEFGEDEEIWREGAGDEYTLGGGQMEDS